MNGWNGCDLQLCYLVQFIFTGVGQYIQPIIATNYGGGNCGVIHQCHVFEIFSDIRVLRKNSEDEVTDSKYFICNYIFLCLRNDGLYFCEKYQHME